MSKTIKALRSVKKKMKFKPHKKQEAFFRDTRKCVVIGGDIISKSDSQSHYITAQMLTRLYGLNPNECYMAEENRPETLRAIPRNDLPVFRPRYDGDYKVKDIV